MPRQSEDENEYQPLYGTLKTNRPAVYSSTSTTRSSVDSLPAIQEEKTPKKTCGLFFFAAGSVLGNTGQVILLDLFIASFHNYDNNCKPISSTAGPFFVLLFCSLLFNIGFWPVVAVKLCASKTSIAITPETWTYTMSKNHWKICMIGVFDALNGFLIVYASSPNRVPSDLQPIVLQTIIPMTILLSFVILRKRYVAWQLVGAGLVVAAVAISLIPTFMDVAKHEKTLRFESGIGWLFVFILGTVPAVLMNIFEEWVFDDTDNKYDIWVLLSFESLYQVLTFLALFWLDIVPGFGTSQDISQWADSVKGGFQCVFAPESMNFTAAVNATSMYDYNHCQLSAVLGFLFTAAYVMSYVFGALLMKYASANFAGIVTSIGSPLAVIFWFAFPEINKWQCGPHAGTTVIIFSAVALIPMAGGAFLFRRFEYDREVEIVVDCPTGKRHSSFANKFRSASKMSIGSFSQNHRSKSKSMTMSVSSRSRSMSKW